jgi:addiction module HigA family antidote
MQMYNPPHPGELIKDAYIDELGVSERDIAKKLHVAPSTFNRIIQGKSAISPEMALRLSKTLGKSPEFWLGMQHQYDLWIAKQKVNLDEVETLEISA